MGLLVPMFVSSDVIKERIESEFARNTSGSLSLDKAKLSAWGGLKIRLEKIKITDAQNKEALNAKLASVSIPFMAIFGMGSNVKVSIQEPKLFVVQSRGKTNWERLLESGTSKNTSGKSTPATQAPTKKPKKEAPPPVPTKKPDSKSQAFWLAPLFNAKVNLNLGKADIQFLSEGESTNVSGVKAHLSNLGLNSNIELVVSGRVDRKAKEEKTAGEFRVDGHLATSFGSPKSFDLTVDLAQMALKFGSQFSKKKSVPLSFEAKGKFAKAKNIQEIIYESLAIALGKNTLLASGKTSLSSPMRTVIRSQGQKLVLDGLGEMVPSMQAMGGDLKVEKFLATVNGESVSVQTNGTIPAATFHLEGKPKPLAVTNGIFNLKHGTSTDIDASINVFGGLAKVAGKLLPQGKNSTANFSYSIEELSIDQSTELFMKDFARTLSGELNSIGKGSVVLGEGLDPLATAVMTGKFNIASAVVRTIDLGKVAIESQKSLGRILTALGSGEKVQDKLSGADSEYDSIAGSYSLKKALFVSDDFYAKAKAEKGIDLRGNTVVNLINKKIKANWMVEDPYNKLGLLEKLSSIKQKALVDLIKNESGVVSFPLTAGCVFDKPCFSLKSAEKFFKSRLKGGLKKNLKKEASGVIKDLIKGGSKKDLKNKAKDLLKGFGF